MEPFSPIAINAKNNYDKCLNHPTTTPQKPHPTQQKNKNKKSNNVKTIVTPHTHWLKTSIHLKCNRQMLVDLQATYTRNKMLHGMWSNQCKQCATRAFTSEEHVSENIQETICHMTDTPSKIWILLRSENLCCSNIFPSPPGREPWICWTFF